MATITEVVSPADWRADEFADVESWVFRVSGGPLAVPGFDQLLGGRGFGLVRGIPVDRDPERVALGLAVQIGRIVPQDDEPLVHVRDRGADPRLFTTRSYQHSAPLSYHADPTDVVALLCVRPAMVGGLSTVVSSVAVHNEVVRTRPDLAAVLYEPFPHEGPAGAFVRPVYQPGGVAYYAPDYITGELTALQREALDLLDALHHDLRFVLTMDLRPGDMQFLDNRVVVHARTAFRDHDDPAMRRDLIRVWISVERPSSER
jgi:hypothetical protein